MWSGLRDDAYEDCQKQDKIQVLAHKLLNIDVGVEKGYRRDDSEAPEENLRQMHLDNVLPDVLLQEMPVLVMMAFRLVVERERFLVKPNELVFHGELQDSAHDDGEHEQNTCE